MTLRGGPVSGGSSTPGRGYVSGGTGFRRAPRFQREPMEDERLDNYTDNARWSPGNTANPNATDESDVYDRINELDEEYNKALQERHTVGYWMRNNGY